MSRETVGPRARALGALALVIAGSLVLPAAATGDDADAADSGVVEIPWDEDGEIRPAEGWTIDCADTAVAPGGIPDLALTCAAEGVTLSAPFVADAGQSDLVVAQTAGAARAEVRYRVVLAPPDAPEIGAEVIDAPLPVGAQTLIPLSMLDLTCTLCDSSATIAVALGGDDAPEASDGATASPAATSDTGPPDAASVAADVGVTGTHLVVRPSDAGDVLLDVTLTDSAGTATTARITAHAVAADDADPVALHLVTTRAAVELGALAWGDGVVTTCISGPSVCLDGTAVSDGPGSQAAVRVVDAAGRQALGSVTFTATDPAATNAAVALAPVSWQGEANLALAVPPPADDGDDETPSPLTVLADILQEVPR